MTRPAEEPGTPLEPPGIRWPREMVTLDRIRLMACYGNPCKCRGFYLGVHHPCITRFGKRRRIELETSRFPALNPMVKPKLQQRSAGPGKLRKAISYCGRP